MTTTITTTATTIEPETVTKQSKCEKDGTFKSKNNEECELLDEAIQAAVQARNWRLVQSLAGELLALEEGGLSLSSSSLSSSSSSQLPSALPWMRQSNTVQYDRLTVLQAQPLMCTDMLGVRHPVPPIDFLWEKKALTEALKDARDVGTVEVVFDIATTDRLNAFFASGQSSGPVLHIGGHGFPDGRLALETGHGATHYVDARHLRDFRSAQLPQVVFVSACHSRSVGEAFLKAGVPHVICCTQAGQLRDSAAVEFTASFYRALANGNTLQEAFDLAKGQVKHSPKVKESHLEVDKFILLPERDDDYHKVQVFFTRPCVQPQVAEEMRSSSLPRSPDPKTFLGRHLDAYSIIEKLVKVDVVHLFGPAGIGKKSLAAFVANYMNERRKIHYIDQVIWCPPLDPNSSDSIDRAFLKIYDLVKTTPDILRDKKYQRFKRQILLHLGLLGCQRTLLVINTCDLASTDVSMLAHALQDILNRLKSIKMIILSKQSDSVHLPKSIRQDFFELQPLTFDTTVTLFAMHCEYVSQQSEHADPIVHSANDFINLIFRRNNFRYVNRVEPDMPQRGRELFVTLGEGHPETILNRARCVSPDEYRTIIMTAKKFDVIVEKFYTRYKLEKAILRTNMDIHNAEINGAYYKAKSLWDVVQDMERRRETLPSKKDLEQLIEEATTKYNNDVANGQIPRRELHGDARKLKDLKTQLLQERNAEKDAELPEDWLIRTHDVSEAPGDVSEDAASLEDIPLVARMKVVDDQTVPVTCNPELSFIPLVKFKINAVCPFVLQINHGPVQSFAYHSKQLAAIVVASNEACTGGQGVLRSVTNAGGAALLRDVEALPTVMDTTYGSVRCMAGDARIVGPGNYDQLQVQYVMFAVAPWFAFENESHARVFLTSAYRSALELAKDRKLEAVAFSLIGANCRGGKRRMETVRIAVDFCVRFQGYPELKEIHLFGFTQREAEELETASKAAGENFDMRIID